MENQPQVLAVKLTVKGERSVRSEHPWIFSESIEKINKEGTSGDIAIIFSHTKNKAIGVGLYDPDSPIRIKMLHHGSGAKLNQEFFTEKITKAFALRYELLATKTNSYRLLFGENDGFPGLIADVYDKVLVIKVYSAIWFPYLMMILDGIISVIDCETVVGRLSRKLQSHKSLPFEDGEVLHGTLANEVVRFVEHGVNFSANVIKGHKTGYFLDHRFNRKRVGELSKGRKVLDVFSYAGGFSVHALVGGAKSVTSVDISKQALALAKDNASLNEFTGKHQTLDGDAFEVLLRLINEGKRYEVVVIDPPSFAKSKKEVDVAKKKYAQLAQLGEKLTTKGGMLVMASCSSRILASEFFEIIEKTFTDQRRDFRRVEKTKHDIDHPVTFPEGAYLKCGYYNLQ